MVHNFLDLTVLGEGTDDNTCEGPIDLQSLDQDGLGYESESGDLLHDTVVRGLIEDDGVLRLIFDFAL